MTTPTKTRKPLSAFTIVEVMIVMIILTVLATIALPKYTTIVEKNRSSEATQILIALAHAQKAYRFEHGSFTNVLANLDIDIATPRNFALPTVTTADPVASITRTGSLYSLHITVDGTITCNGDGSTGLCNKIGF